jgi:hypothetical protein
MAIENFNPKGVTKSTKPSAGGANIYSTPMFGIVKDNIDPTRTGRLRVYISDMNGDPDVSDNWITVGYMNTFFGKTSADGGKDSNGNFVANPSSYGDWHSPPDIGTTVICIFINGDPNYGYYVGCVPDTETLHMVPAIGSSDNVIPNSGEASNYGGALRLPVGNINPNNSAIADSDNYLSAPKPIHSYVSAIMMQQGIIRDPIRGPISSSAQREAVSRVGWGISTPGRPIYEGGYTDQTLPENLNKQGLNVVARRGGHSIVLDDGDLIGKDQLIRIRSALGHQIMMSDDGQTLSILHSNGQSYIELGKEGTIDIFSTNSFNVRTQGDVNLHADNNINLHTNKTMNIKAKNFNLDVEEKIAIRAGTDLNTFATNNITAKAGGSMSLGALGDASMKANGNSYINGTKVNLNSGEASLQPEEVPVLPINAQTDTLNDKEKGFIAAPGKLLSVTSRTPAHYPWANAGQGVDIKTDSNADSQLPAAPSTAVSDITQAGISSNPTSIVAATVASVPNSTAVSSAMDAGVTNAALASVATNAATGAAKDAVAQGAGIVNTSSGPIAAIGSYAQNPTQLANSGILKPGSDKLVNGMICSGTGVTAAMAPSLFTGVPGASNLQQFTSNTTAQTASMVSNMQQGQSALQAAGVITGKEAPTQIAGLVTSASTAGIGSTIGSIASGIGGAVGGAVSGITKAAGSLVGGALNAIGMGSAAAGLASSLGGFGGISNSLSALQKSFTLTSLTSMTLGVAGAAFSSIKNSLPTMQANVPQNLTSIAKSSLISNSAVSAQNSQLSNSLVSSVTGLNTTNLNSVNSITGSISKISATTSNLANSNSIPINAVASLNALSGVNSTLATAGTKGLTAATNALHIGSVSSTISSMSTGVNNLPGGANVINSVVNNASGAINSIPGMQTLSSVISGAQSSAMSGLPMPSIPNGVNSLTSLTAAGLPASQASQLLSSISSLGSGTNGAIKIPTVGVATNVRSLIDSQITNVLGDPKIPFPTFLKSQGKQ